MTGRVGAYSPPVQISSSKGFFNRLTGLWEQGGPDRWKYEHAHYSRTCWEPEEIIDGKERDKLARVDVRLEPGSCALQVGNGQALGHAKILLVGMTAHTARSRP